MKHLEGKEKMMAYYMGKNLIITTIALIIVTLAIVIFEDHLVRFQPIIKIGYPLVFLYYYIMAIVAPIVEARTFSYDINLQRLSFTRGVYRKTTVIIPMHRMQHLTTITSLIAKKFDVGRLEIVTTNGTHIIQYITCEEAQILSEKLSENIFKKQVSDHE